MHGLLRILTAVHDATKAGFSDPLELRHPRRGAGYVSEQLLILFRRITETGEMLARHNQNMDRSMRIEVAKRHHRFVLIHNLCWDLSQDELAEDAVGHKPV